MSREAYEPPSITTGAGSLSQGQPTGSFAIGPAGSYEDSGKPVNYLCGDCDTKVSLKKGDPIRCKECGYRVLYKERTNRYAISVGGYRCWNELTCGYRMIQFEAR